MTYAVGYELADDEDRVRGAWLRDAAVEFGEDILLAASLPPGGCLATSIRAEVRIEVPLLVEDAGRVGDRRPCVLMKAHGRRPGIAVWLAAGDPASIQSAMGFPHPNLTVSQ